MSTGLLCQNVNAHLIQLLDPVSMIDIHSSKSIFSLKNIWTVTFIRSDNSTLSVRRYMAIGIWSEGMIRHYSCRSHIIWTVHAKKIKAENFHTHFLIIANVYLKHIKVYKSKCYFALLYLVVPRKFYIRRNNNKVDFID